MRLGTASTVPGSAWLSCREREPLPLTSPFNIGRSSKCRLALDDTRVSREHTLIQFNDVTGYWLVIDLGSTNGTYLNGQRIARPMPLKDGDEIRIGDAALVFHHPSIGVDGPAEGTVADQTAIAIAEKRCWLLLADVAQSTRLAQQIPPGELSVKLRRWARDCETIVHTNGGLVNEYLGDGLLAFWLDTPDMASRIPEVLRRLMALESESGLAFRVVCHNGVIGIGGGMSSGLEKLAGKDLNFVFKIEKSAALTGRRINLTAAAASRLSGLMELEMLGAYAVPGFDGTHKLYAPFSTDSAASIRPDRTDPGSGPRKV
jgi:pSer/pThr/pTyr-binding forkhead associated (FHA) protein